MKYRGDIDGLRAIAVLSVVLFHLGFDVFAGGFVGVDVFFVISGYLITSITKHKFEQDRFKLSDFYFQRIRRLIPPLLATIAMTVVAASFILQPLDMISFARSAVAASFSVSNILFYSETGYWDTASELKPLLHTWSLGVEEQFYLFWPALLLLILRVNRALVFNLVLVLLSLFGAVLCIGYTQVDQSAAFYLLPFRVFQFALGALVIPLSNLAVTARMSRLYFPVGIALIVYSVLSLGDGTAFPGWVVLLPTMGTVLVLLAGTTPDHRFANLLLENRVSIWVGRVSYSMYLVHWPVIALYRYQFGVELQIEDQLILAAATLVLTVLLHYGVEKRFYRHRFGESAPADRLSGPQFAGRIALLLVILSLPMVHAWTGDGWSWRFPGMVLTPTAVEEGTQRRYLHYREHCSLRRFREPGHCDLSGKQLNVLVIGNSHVTDGFNFVLGGWADTPGLNLILFGSMNVCKDMRVEEGSFVTQDSECRERLTLLFEESVVDAVDLVVYSSNRPFRRGPIKLQTLQLLERMKEQNPAIKLITLGGFINTKEDCSRLINEAGSFDACKQPENVSYFGNQPESRILYERAMSITDHFVDRVALLCESSQLEHCMVEVNGVPAFYDRHHLSLEFAKLAGQLYAQTHPDLLRDLASK